MSAATRGTWNFDAAIMQRWTDANLRSQFINQWPTAIQTSTEFLTFYDTEAAPTKGNTAHPRPYCVYERQPPIPIGGASGPSSDTIVEYQDIDFQFTVFAGDKASAVQFIKLVAAAFDRKAISLQDDSLIELFRLGDFGTREDDHTYSWTLPYRARIEVKYNAALS